MKSQNRERQPATVGTGFLGNQKGCGPRNKGPRSDFSLAPSPLPALGAPAGSRGGEVRGGSPDFRGSPAAAGARADLPVGAQCLQEAPGPPLPRSSFCERKGDPQTERSRNRRSPNVPQRHDLRPPPQKPPASPRQSGSRHLQLQEGDLRVAGVAAGHPDYKRAATPRPRIRTIAPSSRPGTSASGIHRRPAAAAPADWLRKSPGVWGRERRRSQ